MAEKAFIAKSPFGLFAFTENGDMIYYEMLSIKKALIANKEIPESFLKAMRGYEMSENPVAYTFLRREFREKIKELTGKSDVEINSDIIEFSTLISRSNLKSAISKDKVIIQASNGLEDLKKTINLYNERIYEWFSLHYPELKKRDADMIAKHGRRENFPGFKESLGVDFDDKDEAAVKQYADMIVIIEKGMNSLEKYISTSMQQMLPNVCSLVEPILAAKLLANAGSIERMAKMPASTIQLLGAEKALFRHLKKRGKSPKFGILFSDKRVQEAPKEKQGKVARLIAAKIMLAARIDFYSKRKDTKLKESLDMELKKI